MKFTGIETYILFAFLFDGLVFAFQLKSTYSLNFAHHTRLLAAGKANRRDSGDFDNREKTKPMSNPPKKGFGAVTPKATTSSVNKQTPKENLEGNIQSEIRKIPGLQEYMDLKDDVEAWKISHTNSNVSIPQEITDKMGKLDSLTQQGFSASKTSEILNQITWDASASFRHQRHSTMAISESAERFMQQVATWCLPNAASSANNILDCGTGDGILVRFLKKVVQETKKQSSISPTFQLLGIDLSENMINIAKGMYPDHLFRHIGFMEYCASTMDPKFVPDVVVFNECLHYFHDTSEALHHADSLFVPSGNHDSVDVTAPPRRVRIVVSHPKGFNNVILQRSVNHHLVPSLLPTKEEVISFAEKYKYDTLVLPDTKASSYLFVLEKKI